jgi:hypothetical protein
MPYSKGMASLPLERKLDGQVVVGWLSVNCYLRMTESGTNLMIVEFPSLKFNQKGVTLPKKVINVP